MVACDVPAVKPVAAPKNGTTSPAGKKAVKASSDGSVHKEAMGHFIAGKRHLLVKDLDAAVESLAKACELLSAEHGETAYECADAYYYYGKALLDMARAEAGVFGNALDGVPDGEDSDNSQVEDPEKMTEEEREDVEKKVGEALDENFTAMEEKLKNKSGQDDDSQEETETEDDGQEKTKDEETKDNDDKPEDKEAKTDKEGKNEDVEMKESGDVEKKDSEKEKNGHTETNGDGETNGHSKDAENGEENGDVTTEEDEEPSNLQLSWEMLELAKVCYSKHLETLKDDGEKKIVEAKMCETLLTLGENSLESSNHEQAITDISDCLQRRKASLPSDSRRIAETLYQLGVAQSHHNSFDDSIKTLEEAIALIEKRIQNLKDKTESVDESKTLDTFYTREGEISELESLIPDIREKIQDIKDTQSEEESKPKEEEGFSKGEESKSAKPVSSIQIKRKAESSVSPQKKPHVENGTAAVENGVTNGSH